MATSTPADDVIMEQMEEDGYAILSSALPECVCRSARDSFLDKLSAALSSGSTEAFSKIQTPENRRDLRLGMDRQVEQLVRMVVTRYQHVYERLLAPDAELVELGVMTSHPGSKKQIVHSDVTYVEDAQEIYTTFVALQEVDASMGPTLIWPGTHTGYFCEFYKPRMLGPVDQYYTDNPPAEMVIGAGDAVLMDTRVMHCAGGNVSTMDRMLLHFSFQTKSQKSVPDGFTYHLLPELKGQYTLSYFLQEVVMPEDFRRNISVCSPDLSSGLLSDPVNGLWDLVGRLVTRFNLEVSDSSRGCKAWAVLALVRSTEACQRALQDALASLEAKESKTDSDWSSMAFACELFQDYVRCQKFWEKALDTSCNGANHQYNLERVRRELQSHQTRESRLSDAVLLPGWETTVERRSAADMSVYEFRQAYVLRRRPVIITGLGNAMYDEPWTMEWLSDKFGSKLVHCSRCAPDSMNWAALESHDLMTIRDFISVIQSRGTHKGIDAKSLYLFDVSLPIHVRDMLSCLRIPKYFAHDYLQRTPQNTPFRDSWPTLFVGPEGSSSALHIDQSHTNFYMILMEGAKRWVFFHPDDVDLLYPTWARGQLDPTFEPLDAMLSNKSKPLVSQARRVECILQAGEVLFVPAGAPHFVENLSDTVAVSGNFIDDSNIEGALAELKISGLKNKQMQELAEMLEKMEFEEPDLVDSLPLHQMAVPYEDFHEGRGHLLPRF